MGRSILASAAVLFLIMTPTLANNRHGPPAGGIPYGFSQGAANWKSGSGVPPGWSPDNGNKTGWSCGGHHHPCKPPGLASK